MIILRIFHTYKEDFPLLLLRQNGSYLSFNGDTLDDLMTGLILELSDLATLPPFAYISRHSPDKNVPPEDLAPFLARFPEFVARLGKDKQYYIPTIWFVGHFQDYESVAEARQELNQKDLKYFESGKEYSSFDQFNETYWEENTDAEPFVNFLHQATMIGLDLLKTADYKQKLKQLGRLEYMRYPDTENVMEEVKSDLKDMERYLSQNCQYYREHIVADESKYKQFWVNFTKWKTSAVGTGSWPHFLFNICGVSYLPTCSPLRVRPEQLFEDWW